MKKTETITIRTTEEEKKKIEELATRERRTVGGLLYIWIIDKLEQEKK